jgi:lipoyl(octanoyl) transferase
VAALEQSVIDLLGQRGIPAGRREDAPGVYVEGEKIAALGLRIRRGHCYHGLSCNIAMDLTPFSNIDPCGYAGLKSTQLIDHLAEDEAAEQDLKPLSRELVRYFCAQI